MKHITTVLAILFIGTSLVLAADPLKDPLKHTPIAIGTQPGAAATVPPATSWYDNIHAGPVGAIRSDNITGPSQWGAGLDIGYEVNKYVSIDVLNLSFEGPGKTKDSVEGSKGSPQFRSVGEDRWGGLLIDETDLDVRANLVTFATERFKPYVVASGVRDWNKENWGIGVGAGASLYLAKYVSFGGSYRIRSFFNEQKSGLGELHLDFKLP